ncbi:NAD(+) diphosphatase [Agromyces sp. CF514]|uniref:NAD(+) diphosphatase n=1 Tax=Agromyces sp. CF514 TaxID=1881031 RepID=UPI00210195A9|nr:NAD(+) diphosphatase [Agromyces sp. CF514]
MRESTPPPLARARLDRDGATRGLPDRSARFDADPEARVLLLHDGRALLTELVEGVPPVLDLRSPAEAARAIDAGAGAVELRVYLGRALDDEGLASSGAPIEVWAIDAAATDAIEAEAARWVGLRQAAPMLSDRDSGLFTQAAAIVNWHRASGFCPRCGAPTDPIESGWSRRCRNDGGQVFPRTDAAVIVLVTDADDRVLLGSNAMWQANRFSLLAGFVEPGESLESAVVREIGEEAGLEVVDVAYVASQPWPFPASLMLGFTARAVSAEAAASVRPDGEEILELRWFSRAELAAALPEVGFPGRTSIAGWLLEQWYGGPIESSPQGWGA